MKKRVAWNKGLTKETDSRVAKYAYTKLGSKGHSAWNKGLSCDEETKIKISKSLQGRKTSHKADCKCSWCHTPSGRNNKNFNRTLEDIYGQEHATKIKQQISQKNTGRVLSKETREKISIAFTGENHPNWLGGSSYQEYSFKFTQRLKEKIRIRDNHICQICSKSQKENGRKLDIHHIDYDKTNCNNNNLLSLCKSCHMKTNFNRERWEKICLMKIKGKLSFAV